MSVESSRSKAKHECDVCRPNGGIDSIDITNIRTSATRRGCLWCSIASEAIQKILPERFPQGSPVEVLRRPFDESGFKVFGSGNKILDIDIFTTQIENAPTWISKRRIPSGDTFSNAAFQWATAWLDYCQREHEMCTIGDGTSLPTRLIDVTPLNDRGDVRLVNEAFRLPFGRYDSNPKALSHCWGETIPNCRTVMNTIDDRMTNINLDDLPKTYRDAILFTRELRIRWIWIDSICIVQDDIIDWRHEAGKMSEVYGNSFVTLAAVHSKDSSGGLFSQVSSWYETFELTPINIDGTYLPIYCRRSLPNLHSWEVYPYMHAPLFRRAWTYQERLVSKRVIYFTKHELLWECCQGVGCECVGDASPSPPGPLESNFNSLYFTWSNCPKIKHSRDIREGKAVHRSHETIEEYSGLDLTFRTDRLPAISAVAKQIHSIRPHDRYIAGLWLNTLILDLLWVPTTIGITRPKVQSFPTWSWASFDGQVQYRGSHYSEIKYKYHADLVNAICRPISDDEYGQIEFAQLILRSQLVECNINRMQDDRGRYSAAEAHIQKLDKPVSISFDFESDCQDGETLYILRVAEVHDGVECSSGSYFNRFHHLLLREVSETGFYYRVGSFFLRENVGIEISNRIFDGEPYSTIKIE